MKVTYDTRTDTLLLQLRDDSPVAESREHNPGVVLDYDDGGNLVSVEILDASVRVSDAGNVEFRTVG